MVIHLRPLRCWTRTWTLSALFPASLSSPSSNPPPVFEKEGGGEGWRVSVCYVGVSRVL